MLESGSSGSVRGASSNGRPYREPRPFAVLPDQPHTGGERQKAAVGATGSLAGASKLEANWSRDWGRERTPDAAEVNTDY